MRVDGVCCGAMAVALLAACATTKPPSEFEEARTELRAVEFGLGGETSGRELGEAREAFARAERAVQGDPGSDETLHLAKMALRKAQIVRVLVHTRLARQRAARAEHDAARVAAKLGEDPPSFNDVADYGPGVPSGDLQAEQTPGPIATALSEVATLRNTATGASLSFVEKGRAMFATGSAALPSWMHHKLDRVARVLAQKPGWMLVVEGFTDDTGSEAGNRALSLDRAAAARAYLLARGIDANRVEAVGRSSSDPVASNDDHAGRGQNRRIEIRIEPFRHAR